ncbi:MAG: DUF4388 domain-containing protein [Candidatus Electrothrix sp. AR4]|nr:DUF4388 domain-containing protein [Candidatus Electrothrix sp. AR4]
MKNKTLISYKDFMLALYQLCIEKQTGTMFITADDHHSMLIALHNGDIVACRSGVKEGYEAIQAIKTIISGQYSFDERLHIDDKSASLPLSTDALLKELSGKNIDKFPVLALYQLCIEKQAGTMYIATKNHTIQFVLRDGNIVACRSGTKEGYKAIEENKMINSGRYSFDKNFFIDNNASIPFLISTDTLLKELAGQGAHTDVLTDAEFSAIKTVIEEELTNTIGPIASIICEDHFDGVESCTLDTLSKLIDDITMEITKEKKKEFKNQLIAKLDINM